MERENLSGMTTQELYEWVMANPQVAAAVAENDPRVKLMQAIDKDPKRRLALRKMGKEVAPTAFVPEVDIPASIEPLLAERDKKIETLEKKITERDSTDAHRRFRADLAGYAEEYGWKADTKELDEIETFMVENHFGEKSARHAVRAWVETKDPAEPNAEPTRDIFNFADEDSKYLAELQKAPIGSDTSALTIANANRLAKEMGVFGADGKIRRSPAFAGR